MVTHTTLSLLPAFLILMQTLQSVTPSSNTSSCFVSERNALLNFKHTLIDPSNRLSSWIGGDCCTWLGIHCSKQTGHVVQLNLRNPIDYANDDWDKYCLGGELHISLQNLKHLTHLDLSLNNFFTNIPDFFGSFTNLTYLNLSNSYFTGKLPHHLGNPSSLQYLDLSSNNYGLQNESLWWVSHLFSLKHLDLSGIYLSNATDWFPAINMLPSLLVLKLRGCKLDLSSNIPSNINFTSLVSLDLSNNNYLKANIVFDWLYNITGLEKLSLFGNYYGGPIPESIYTLRSITFLDLSDNELKGPIPTEISNLTKLTYLNLGHNEFTGSLPGSFIKLDLLESFYIYANQLNGTIPTFISGLSKLQSLDMGDNRMSGVISHDYFHNLTRLKYLDLSSNTDLVVNFSSTWTPPFQLISLGLSSLKMGPGFPRWLRNQTNLEYLYLSDANIDDIIPPWFSSLNNLRGVDLSGNKLRGNPLLIHTNIDYLDVSNNLLSGLLITNATTNSLDSLYASNNILSGAFPAWLCNIKTIRLIYLSNNQLSGTLPSCLGSLDNLYILDLTNNSFYGSLPGFLGSPPLYSLQLRNKKFKGRLPSSFQNLIGLKILDVGENAITGIIPTWIGQTLSALTVLILRSNRFHGPIPQQLCQLYYLQTLNLAQNNISGSIPSCFHNLTAMILPNHLSFSMHGVKILEHIQPMERLYDAQYFISMDLSNNNIVGVIPTDLMKLVQLLKLNVSGNHIEGRIPDKIGNLIQLQSLDLSRNKLSGPIPQSLSNLSFLSNLNLSFNNLSGEIPTGFQLQTLTDPSIYMGNRQLCGAPLDICGGEDGSSDHSHKEESDVNDNDDDNVEVWFYSGMGPGLLVGFLGFCGALHFNKKWRCAYIRFFENVYDTLAVTIAIRAARLHQKFKKHRTEG